MIFVSNFLAVTLTLQLELIPLDPSRSLLSFSHSESFSSLSRSACRLQIGVGFKLQRVGGGRGSSWVGFRSLWVAVGGHGWVQITVDCRGWLQIACVAVGWFRSREWPWGRCSLWAATVCSPWAAVMMVGG